MNPVKRNQFLLTTLWPLFSILFGCIAHFNGEKTITILENPPRRLRNFSVVGSSQMRDQPTIKTNQHNIQNSLHHHQTPSSPIRKPGIELPNGPESGFDPHHIRPSYSHRQLNRLPTGTTDPTLSFYKRQLPEGCLSFTSDKGKALFSSALATGHLESYFPLTSQLVTQNEPAFCGLATLCTVLNALGVDPKRVWKHPWRWFDQDMLLLDSCQSLESIRKDGMTLAQFNCMARRNGLTFTSQSPPAGAPENDPIGYQNGLQEFRLQVVRTTALCSAFLVVSFCRQSLGQTGTGHFSPVAGYSPEEDQVLVLDVARFKYPYYWVGLEDLYKSMIPVDLVSQRPRGYTILSHPHSITRINLNKSSWDLLSLGLSPILESVKAEPLLIASRRIYDYISTSLAKVPNPIEVRPGLESEAEILFQKISALTRLLVDHNHRENINPLFLIFALAVLSPDQHDPDLQFLKPELSYLRAQMGVHVDSSSLQSGHNQYHEEHCCGCEMF